MFDKKIIHHMIIKLLTDYTTGVAFEIIFSFDKARNNAYACKPERYHISTMPISLKNFIEKGLLLQYVIRLHKICNFSTY